MRLALPLIIAFALAACSQAEPEPQPTSTTEAPASPPAVIADAGPPQIPERFRGVWDYEEGTCNPASDLRIDIGPRAIEFYESHGEVTGIRIESPDSVVVELAMEGEGEEWTLERRFTLSEGGERLLPEATDPDEDYGPMPLKRCEG